jgi:hypothetical protein
VALAWVSGDSVYGDDRKLRGWLEQRKQAYVLAVSFDETVWMNHEQRSITTILAELPSITWERLSAGVGSKGPRTYDWQRLELSDPAQPGWKRFLLVRRSICSTICVLATAYGLLLNGRWSALGAVPLSPALPTRSIVLHYPL